MSRPILMVVVPPRLVPVLGTALQAHPHVAVRDAVQMQRFRAELDSHTRARVHSDKLPWEHDTDWVDHLVDAQVGRLARGRDPRCAAWSAQLPAEAATIQRALAARPLVWVADPRHAVRLGAPDPVAAAAASGVAWARQAAAARALPDAVRATDPPVAVLAAFALPRHAGTEAALGMLGQLPAPRLPAAVLGALAAHPDAAAALVQAGLQPPPPPDAAGVLVVRAEHAPTPDARRALAERALALGPGPALRARALDTLCAADGQDRARALLVRWMREEDALPAWSRLLTNRTGRPDPTWVHAARAHADPAVRGALARWLVSEGLDRQAAETVCRVRGTHWFRTPGATPA